jgi:hypothetical protein
VNDKSNIAGGGIDQEASVYIAPRKPRGLHKLTRRQPQGGNDDVVAGQFKVESRAFPGARGGEARVAPCDASKEVKALSGVTIVGFTHGFCPALLSTPTPTTHIAWSGL